MDTPDDFACTAVEADLLLAGFMRGTGPIAPLDVARVSDVGGNPIRYKLLVGIEQLNGDDRVVFESLGTRFRFKDVRTALGGTSDSNASRFVKKCCTLQIVKKDGLEYVKTIQPVERMEAMESHAGVIPALQGLQGPQVQDPRPGLSEASDD